MIASRVVLHLAAVVLPVLATAGVGWVFRFSASDFGSLAVAAVLAAQIAALLGWPLLVRGQASAWLAPLATGLAMAVATHVLFGPAFATIIALTENDHAGSGFFTKMFGFSVYAAAFVGWASAPLVMAVCVLVNRLRRKELDRAAV